ncbi:MAG: glycosyltransferase family 9 protein [Planctomycetota bacterium]
MTSARITLIKSCLRGAEALGAIADRAFESPRTREGALERPPRRVLWWSMDRIGDVARATPALRLLRESLPGAEITACVAGRSAPVLAHSPRIDRRVVVQNPAHLGDHLAALRTLGREPFDLAIIGTAYLPWRCFGEWFMRRLGVARWAALDFDESPMRSRGHAVPLDQAASWIDQFINLSAGAISLAPVRQPGADRASIRLEVFVTPADHELADSFLADEGITPGAAFMLLAPGGNFLTVSRQWPIEAYAQLATMIDEAWSCPIIATGVESERGQVERLMLTSRARVHNACGRLNLRGLIGLLDRARVCVMNDSGPYHLASGLGKPCVVVLGPTAPSVVGVGETAVAARADLPCSPCAHLHGWQACTNPNRWECLEAVTPAEVFRLVRDRAAAAGLGQGGPVTDAYDRRVPLTTGAHG